MNLRNNIAVLITALVAISCAPKHYIQLSPTALTPKDSLLMENNTSFPDVTIVGGGAKLIKAEQDSIYNRNILQQVGNLQEVQGISVDTYVDALGRKQIKATLEGDLLFAFNQAQLNESAQEVLSNFVKALTNESLMIVGHTDNVGDEKYNELLSLSRAVVVKTYLENLGYAGEIETIGKGMSQPLNGNSNSEEMAKNRRVEIFIQKAVE